MRGERVDVVAEIRLRLAFFLGLFLQCGALSPLELQKIRMPPKRPRGDTNAAAVKTSTQKTNKRSKEGDFAECPTDASHSTSTSTSSTSKFDSGVVAELEAAILKLLRSRKPGANCCPSEVPRMLSGEKGGDSWRSRMPAVREAAARLVESGQLEITQRGSPVPDPRDFRGPIRLRLRL